MRGRAFLMQRRLPVLVLLSSSGTLGVRENCHFHGFGLFKLRRFRLVFFSLPRWGVSTTTPVGVVVVGVVPVLGSAAFPFLSSVAIVPLEIVLVLVGIILGRLAVFRIFIPVVARELIVVGGGVLWTTHRRLRLSRSRWALLAVRVSGCMVVILTAAGKSWWRARRATWVAGRFLRR